MRTCDPKELSLGLYVSALQNLVPIMTALEEENEMKDMLTGVGKKLVERIHEKLDQRNSLSVSENCLFGCNKKKPS